MIAATLVTFDHDSLQTQRSQRKHNYDRDLKPCKQYIPGLRYGYQPLEDMKSGPLLKTCNIETCVRNSKIIPEKKDKKYIPEK